MPRPRQRQGRPVPPHGLRPPGVQILRPACEDHERHLPQGARPSWQERRPASRGRGGAGEDCSLGRVLCQEELVSQRGLLLGDCAAGHGDPRDHVHCAVRGGTDCGLGGAVEGDGLAEGPQDHAAAAALHRGDAPGAAPSTSSGGRGRQAQGRGGTGHGAGGVAGGEVFDGGCGDARAQSVTGAVSGRRFLSDGIGRIDPSRRGPPLSDV
mmetsp:Transcript_45572/g.145078  ORF Transcript_45572/g.145078 Transcript_45572/m.145078 type:complete len:210 (-) Transcript_45572:558-1187(-)